MSKQVNEAFKLSDEDKNKYLKEIKIPFWMPTNKVSLQLFNEIYFPSLEKSLLFKLLKILFTKNLTQTQSFSL